MSESLTANDLASKTSGEVKNWLENVSVEQITPDSEFNWLGLASVAGSMMREAVENGDKKSSFEWAEISLKVYEKLAESSEKSISFSNEMSAMIIRIFMINNFGDLKGDYILDSQKIIDWLHGNLDLSLDDALEKSNKWRRLIQEKNLSELETDRDELIKIRRIKNCLGVIEALKITGKVSIENEIQKWLVEKSNFI